MRFWRRLEVKLTAGFLLVGILAALAALPALDTVRRLTEANRRLTEETLPVTRTLEEIRFETVRLVAASRQEFLERSLPHAAASAHAGMPAVADRLDRLVAVYGEQVQRFFPDEKELLEAIETEAGALQATAFLVGRLAGDVAETATGDQALRDLQGAGDHLLGAVQGALEHEAEEVKERTESVRDAERDTRRYLLTSIAAALFAGLVLGVALGRRLLAPVLALQRAAFKLAEGDLDVRLERTTGDEIGDLVDAFNGMVGGLRQRQQLEQILSSMQDALFVTASDGRIVRANRAASRLLGVAEEDLLGRSLVSFLPHLATSEGPGLDLLMRPGLGVSGTIELVAANGERFPGEASSALIEDAEGGSHGLVATVRDLREKRAAEAELHRHREWLQVTLESVGDGLIATDAAGNVVFMNRVAEQLTGHPREDARGRPIDSIFQIVNEATRAVVSNPALRVLREGVIVGLANHTVLIARDGRERPIDDSGAPIRGADGALLGAVLVFRDVTQRREAGQAIERARVAAERATRAKSEFLATMSHEIRTPMNGVIGMTSLLIATDLDSRQREFVDTIESSGNHLLTIVNDILDFSKIEAGKIDLEERSFDPTALVEEMAALLRSQASAKSLELVVRVGAEVPSAIVSDDTRIRQILSNMLSNAIKFTERGQVELGLEFGTVAGSRSQLVFTVRDTGIGITEAALPSLFDAFSQADASTSRRFGGSGLGLTISARLAELLGGRITVESRLGQGTAFRFLLPLRPGHALLGGPQPPSATPKDPRLEIVADDFAKVRGSSSATAGPPVPPTLAARMPLRLAVIEDNAVNQKVAAAILGALGYGAILAAGGDEFFAQDADVDLVFLDLQMPTMDGYAVMRRLGELYPPAARPIVVALTATVTSADQQRCLEAGMEDYLSKPVTLEDVRAMIEKWADTAQDRRSQRRPS